MGAALTLFYFFFLQLDIFTIYKYWGSNLIFAEREGNHGDMKWSRNSHEGKARFLASEQDLAPGIIHSPEITGRSKASYSLKLQSVVSLDACSQSREESTLFKRVLSYWE